MNTSWQRRPVIDEIQAIVSSDPGRICWSACMNQ